MKKLSIKLHIKRPPKKWLIFSGVSLLSAVLAVACIIAFSAAGRTLPSQSVADKWAGESGIKFAQISLYMPQNSSLDVNKIKGFRQKVQSATADVMPDTVKASYIDAWSGTGKATVAGAHGSSEASVIAVGGDYFYFHPLDLKSGSYITDKDLMKDRVLLDEDLAWKLFGGNDLAGASVTVNGKDYIVAGVIGRESDYADKAAYKGGVGMYMLLDSYNALISNQSGGSGGTTGGGTAGDGSGSIPKADGSGSDTQISGTAAAISCYEVVMPNPVKNFAAGLVTSELNADKTGDVIQNSDRYSASRIFAVIKNTNQRALHTDSIQFPYWENAARLVENRCALFLILELLFWLCPTVLVVILAVKLYKYLKRKTRERYLDLKDRYENRTLFAHMKGSDDDGGTDT